MTLPSPLVAGPRNPRVATDGVGVNRLQLIPLEILPSDAEDGTLVQLNTGTVFRRFAGRWDPLGASSGGGSSGDYVNPDYPSLTTVSAALDYLLYAPVVGTGISVSPSIAEVGQVVSSVTLSWSWSKQPTTQVMAGPGATGLLGADTTKTLLGLSLTSESTWTVTGSDGASSSEQAATLPFRLRRYWGLSSLSTAAPGNLPSSELSSVTAQSRVFSPSAEYLYFSWPSSYGDPVFTVNGMVSTAWVKTTHSVTNSFGHVEEYWVYRSLFIQTATGIQVSVS